MSCGHHWQPTLSTHSQSRPQVPVHYELGATNCLQLLSLAGIPISRDDRQDAGAKPFDVLDGSYPLVFAGGQTVTANPEPFADFFDFFALGDGEDTLPLIARKVVEYKKLRLTRSEVLLHLAQEVPGIYVPQFYARNSDGSVRRTRDDVPARPQRQVSVKSSETPVLQDSFWKGKGKILKTNRKHGSLGGNAPTRKGAQSGAEH